MKALLTGMLLTLSFTAFSQDQGVKLEKVTEANFVKVTRQNVEYSKCLEALKFRANSDSVDISTEKKYSSADCKIEIAKTKLIRKESMVLNKAIISNLDIKKEEGELEVGNALCALKKVKVTDKKLKLTFKATKTSNEQEEVSLTKSELKECVSQVLEVIKKETLGKLIATYIEDPTGALESTVSLD